LVRVDLYDDVSKTELRSHRVQVLSQSLFGPVEPSRDVTALVVSEPRAMAQRTGGTKGTDGTRRACRSLLPGWMGRDKAKVKSQKARALLRQHMDFVRQVLDTDLDRQARSGRVRRGIPAN
jgi:hypothetical protein